MGIAWALGGRSRVRIPFDIILLLSYLAGETERGFLLLFASGPTKLLPACATY